MPKFYKNLATRVEYTNWEKFKDLCDKEQHTIFSKLKQMVLAELKAKGENLGEAQTTLLSSSDDGAFEIPKKSDNYSLILRELRK